MRPPAMPLLAVLLRFLLALLVLAPAAGTARGVDVDLELVLLADSSGSIDVGEHQFQREGYAAAIVHQEVLKAIASGPRQRIAVTYVEWADASSQDIVVPWTVIDGPKAAEAFAEALRNGPPRRAYGRNAIGSALDAGRRLIQENAINGERLVIDFSADSANSWMGPPVSEARKAAIDAGITINGLAILCREGNCGGRAASYDLEGAFARTIIGGPGAFVVTADGRSSFTEAVRRKLVLEMSAAPPVVTDGVRFAAAGPRAGARRQAR